MHLSLISLRSPNHTNLPVFLFQGQHKPPCRYAKNSCRARQHAPPRLPPTCEEIPSKERNERNVSAKRWSLRKHCTTVKMFRCYGWSWINGHLSITANLLSWSLLIHCKWHLSTTTSKFLPFNGDLTLLFYDFITGCASLVNYGLVKENV